MIGASSEAADAAQNASNEIQMETVGGAEFARDTSADEDNNDLPVRIDSMTENANTHMWQEHLDLARIYFTRSR